MDMKKAFGLLTSIAGVCISRAPTHHSRRLEALDRRYSIPIQASRASTMSRTQCHAIVRTFWVGFAW